MKTGADRKKVWITGGSGFLGGTLNRFLKDRFEIVLSAHRNAVSGSKVDLNSRTEIAEFIAKQKPAAIVHCAALTDVDYCETHFDEAVKVNAEASGLLAEEAAKAGIYFIFVSTEAVYGDTQGPHREDELLNPVNRYAVSKLKGEEAVRKAGGKQLIARTGFEGWALTGSSKLSFFEWLTRMFAAREKFYCFEDRIFTPFSVYNFAEVIAEMIDREIEGLYNVEGPEAVSYLEFARRTAKTFGYDAALAVPAKMDEVLKGSKRPHDTTLDVNKIQARLKTRLLGVDEILLQFKNVREIKGDKA